MFKDKNNNYRLKIAFDFDDTLTKELFFTLAKHLIRKGHDVWIMTARSEKDSEYMSEYKKLIGDLSVRNADVIEMAHELGIDGKIIYTNLDEKSTAFKNSGFDLLFDDDAEWHCNAICKAGGIAVNV
jgi:phosphoserine phosphatase